MICDTWSDDPVYDQKKRKNSVLGIKTRAHAAHDPYQWPKQGPGVEYQSEASVSP